MKVLSKIKRVLKTINHAQHPFSQRHLPSVMHLQPLGHVQLAHLQLPLQHEDFWHTQFLQLQTYPHCPLQHSFSQAPFEQHSEFIFISCLIIYKIEVNNSNI